MGPSRPGERSATDDQIFATGTPSLLRAINERTILRFLRTQGAASRAQVARVSGLSKPTVSLALATLLRAGLVREVGRSSGGKGPGALLYELEPNAGCVVGIDVGRVWVRAAIADITGGIIARRDERTRARSASALIAGIGELAHDLAGQAGVRWDQVTHATVGSPGVVDRASGTVALAPNLPGWGRRGLVEAVQHELGTGVTIENDVNLAALGEQTDGLGRGVQNFVFLWIGTGVGLGLVLNGRLHRGAHGYAGEIAYLPLGVTDPHDPSTRRHGPLEDAVAAAGIVRTARSLGMAPPLNPKNVFAQARRGDPVAMQVVELTAARLALVIATVAPLVDPELVILGGGIGRNEDLLVDRIGRELRAISPFRPRLAQSALGEDAVLRGAVGAALAMAQERVFARTANHETKRATG
jgi:predicted NBD/HSP70 family sugar kinase